MIPKRPLRILYVLNASGGGATQGILALLRSLPCDEYEAFLVTPDQPDERQCRAFDDLTRAWFQIPMVWWNLKVDLPWYWRILAWGGGWLKTLGHLLPVWQLCRIIRSHDIDIVYTNTVMILDGALAARLCRKPHIWHIKEWVGSQARVKFLLPDSLLVKVITNLSVRVIVMTHFIGEVFVRHNKTQQMQVIYDGVNLSAFDHPGAGAALRETLGIPQNRFLVGMSASLSSTWKRHEVFIKMAALLAARYPEMIFVVFGSQPRRYNNPAYNRPWQYYRSLQGQVKTLGLQKKFYWAGFCDDIPAMMDALDVLVHPCEIEPFGRVVVEAMAASRPVVAPLRGGVVESVVDRETGFLVHPGDADAFADAVAALWSDPRLRADFAVRGRQRAADLFSIEKHRAEICRVYQSLYREVKLR